MEIRQYNNPIIRGFNPDPSICRVGDNYYLIVSSFEYFPGLPVYHSRDLVNWEQIGSCIDYTSSISIAHAKESGGIWAPTIRYHEGTYFVTAAMETKTANAFGNFIIHAKSPEGPWSDPVRIPIGGIDPSIMFEAGRAYYCTNDNTGVGRECIKLGVVDPFTGEIIEEFRPIWYGTGGGWLEAPHVYHIGEWYYCMCAEGGTSFGHSIVIGRSKSIYGPYESCPDNPILTNRNDTDKQACCCGHGDLVEDGNGNWWMVHLGHRSALVSLSQLGRETYLVPVSWENGWPVVRDGKAHAIESGPLLAAQRPWRSFLDDFKNKKWPEGWQFVRKPRMEFFERGEGRLVITPSNAAPKAFDAGSFVCIKQPDLDFKLSVTMSFKPQADGESAGIMLYLTHNFRYMFGIRMKKKKRELYVQRVLDDIVSEDYSVNLNEERVKLNLTGNMAEYSFWAEYADDIRTKTTVLSARFLSNGIVGRGFTGTMAGLFASSPSQKGTSAEFEAFKVTNPGE